MTYDRSPIALLVGVSIDIKNALQWQVIAESHLRNTPDQWGNDYATELYSLYLFEQILEKWC